MSPHLWQLLLFSCLPVVFTADILVACAAGRLRLRRGQLGCELGQFASRRRWAAAWIRYIPSRGQVRQHAAHQPDSQLPIGTTWMTNCPPAQPSARIMRSS